MWKYNHTQRPDELYHWKYTQKVKTPSGRTQYFYNQAELNAYEKSLRSARATTEEDDSSYRTWKKSKIDSGKAAIESFLQRYKKK